LGVDHYDELRRTLDDAMAPVADPVPWAMVEQARRRAVVKNDLLTGGAFTVVALSEAWDTTITNARKRVERYRQQHRIFTVKHHGELLVPLLLLDGDLEPRAELRPAIAALREVGDDGWSLWAWFANPTSWLDGAVPAELAATQPRAVANAAASRAAASAA